MMNRSIFLHAITAALAVGANHATPNPFSLVNPAATLGRERANRSAHRNSGAAAVQRAAKKRRNAKKR